MAGRRPEAAGHVVPGTPEEDERIGEDGELPVEPPVERAERTPVRGSQSLVWDRDTLG